MPGIELNLVGKIESFERDFMQVWDHAQANDALRTSAIKPVNAFAGVDWRNCYTNELANRVYKAYEPDFDRVQYPRKLHKIGSSLIILFIRRSAPCAAPAKFGFRNACNFQRLTARPAY